MSETNQILAKKFNCVNNLSQMVFVIDNICIPFENYDNSMFAEVCKILARLRLPIVLPFNIMYLSNLHLLLLERDSAYAGIVLTLLNFSRT